MLLSTKFLTYLLLCFWIMLFGLFPLESEAVLNNQTWQDNSRGAILAAATFDEAQNVLGLPEPRKNETNKKKRKFVRPKRKLNVLFIAVDDLRLQLGCFGDRIVHSPNIDSLARDGMVFENAYCQQAVCAPTRASLLSGLRPDTTKVYDLETPLRSVLPNVRTLPQHFKENGYQTISVGKIYHHLKDDLLGWSELQYRAKAPGYASEDAMAVVKTGQYKTHRGSSVGPPFEAVEIADNGYADGQNCDYAIEQLRRLKADQKPFFLAMGFLKPHLPFNAPKKYWDRYDPETLPLAANPFPPENATPYSLTDFGELRSYYGMPKKGPLSDEQARQLIHGYYACVSYTDAQVGRLLHELDRLGLRDETIVILWGDHGWKLGEHGGWCKHTNFENDTHVPLVISVPGMEDKKLRTKALVEYVDIYPSLSELCRLPIPQSLEGLSFVPLLENPTLPWKRAAFSQYPRGKVMGYSMKTSEFRYIEWQNRKTGEVTARELYDHHQDPAENKNVVNKPEYAAKVKELSEMLGRGWRGALPKK